jgi:lipid-A-disaccharide synthase
MTRIFISTGEVSGDLQGALLIDALRRQAAIQNFELEIVALGGDRMAAAGAKLLANTSEIGSMGIVESLPFVLPTYQLQRQAKQYLQQHPADLVVLIDYMGPNLAWCEYFAEQAPTVPLVYYIAPQEWVWGDRWKWGVKLFRSELIVRTTQRILAIFPEEARYLHSKGGKVTWVGHPLVDLIQTAPSRADARAALKISPEETAIALLPASRQQEIKYLLPIICQAAQIIQSKLPEVKFYIPLALEKYRPPIAQAIQEYGLRATIVDDRANDEKPGTVTLRAIAAADLALTKSGTVNMEIALLDVPQVVLYKLAPITAWVMRHILKFSVPFVSPANLVMMQPAVPEFVQDEATPEAIAQAGLDLLLNQDRRQQVLANYHTMRQALGSPGVCDRAATEILSLLSVKIEE